MGKALTGKITVVAGGTGAVGVGIVRTFLEEGATVMVPAKSLHEIHWLKEYVADVATGRLLTLLTDQADYDKTIDNVEAIVQEYGPLDLAIAAFDCQWAGPSLTGVEFRDWQKVMDETVTAWFVAARVILYLMKEHAHGMYISIGDADVGEKKQYSSLLTVAAAVQLEMARQFAEDVKGNNVLYYHLLVNNVATREKSPSLIGKPGWITPEMVGRHIIRLYRGETACPENVFQTFLGKPVSPLHNT